MTTYNLAELFAQHAAAAPDQECLVWGRRRLTYGQTERDATALAAAWRELGIGRGDRIAPAWSPRPGGLALWLGGPGTTPVELAARSGPGSVTMAVPTPDLSGSRISTFFASAGYTR